MEAAAKRTDREKLMRKKPAEGELFGVRALENGYFGGVAQSRSNSPAPSYILAPSTPVLDWAKAGKMGSPAGSIRSMEMQEPRNMSVSSLATPKPVRPKISPLRLQPSDAELNGRRNHSVSSVGGIGGIYMPPLPSPRSIRSGTPDSLAGPSGQSTWVSPLDVHFSRPSTPNAGSKPPSFLPQLQFPGEIEKNALIVPTPSGSAINSQAASIVNSIKSASSSPPSAPSIRPEAVEPPSVKAPNFSVFPQQPPSRARRQSQRSIFPVSDDAARPPSRKSPKESQFPVPTIPHEYFPPRSPTIDQSSFPRPGPWNPERPIIRDSVVSKQRVSVYRPQKIQHSREASPEAPKSRSRAHSIAASSMYSTTTTVFDTKDTTTPSHTQRYSRTRSHSAENGGGNRSRSTSSQRARGLSRAQDSLRRHSRKISQDRSAAASKIDKRRSRERDQIHYDPSHHRRNRSGSVQGRAVDFDHPRESPFSNSHAINGSESGKGEGHSANSSVSTTFSVESGIRVSTQIHVKTEDKDDIKPRVPRLELDLTTEKDRLSVNPFVPGHAGVRGRSPSEISQGSIGDFYDAYYRQSMMAQRASVASQVLGINAKTATATAGNGMEMLGVGVNVNGNALGGGNGIGMSPLAAGGMNAPTGGQGKRPPPMNFSRGGAGFSGLKPPETIVELPSPAMSPMVQKERFPTRI